MKKIKKFVLNLQAQIYIWLIKHLYKVKPNSIVFQGKPDYADNPRALCDYLVANGYSDKYDIYYLVNDNYQPKVFYSKVKFFSLHSRSRLIKWKSYKILLTAKYIFTSHAFKIPMHKGNIGQKYITLWHGCGYKNNEGSKLEFNRFFDLALVPGPLFIKTKSKCWNTTAEYLMAKGYPRFDWMLNPSDSAVRFMKQFKNRGKKVIIWMPTYRNSIVDSTLAENVITQFPLMATNENWIKLDEKCRDKSVVMLVKLHMSQRDYGIDFSELTHIVQLSNEDFEKAGVQMYEFLALTDGLVSDYSSVAVDYLVVDKPLAFALDDYELYMRTRGFVFEDVKKYMPGHHLYTVDDLCSYVTDVADENDKYKDDRKRISEIGIYKSENYCKEIVESIGL